MKTIEINILTIADLRRYVRSYGLPNLPIRGFYQIYKHILEALPEKLMPSIKYHIKEKIPIYQDMERDG